MTTDPISVSFAAEDTARHHARAYELWYAEEYLPARIEVILKEYTEVIWPDGPEGRVVVLRWEADD